MIRSIQAGKRQRGGCSFNVFSDDELYDIHLATLEVLERTGAFFDSPEALEVLYDGGATIDKKNRIARIPPHLVDDAVRSSPPKLVLGGRHPDRDVVLENGRIAFSNFGGAVNLVDPYTGEVRRATKADLAASTLLVDCLEDLVLYKGALNASDVPQEVLRLNHAEAMLSNTTTDLRGLWKPGPDQENPRYGRRCGRRQRQAERTSYSDFQRLSGEPSPIDRKSV